MTANQNLAMTANQHQASPKERAVSVQTYARIAGVLFLVSFVGGGFGEFYAPELPAPKNKPPIV